MIYLDYSAHTPPSERTLETYLTAARQFPGNANARHTPGRAAAAEMARISVSIAAMLHANHHDIIFTSGASESNNTALQGIARMSRHHGKHILSTALEHASVSGCLTAMQEQGYEVELVPIDRNGQIDLEEFRAMIRPDTVLVAVCAVDSELGTVQPIGEIAEIVSRYPNCTLHVDATQAVGKLPMDLSDVDSCALSAHKFYGLGGSGLLIKRKDRIIEPLIHGGASTTIYRSGTPDVAAAAALETALSDALANLDVNRAATAQWNDLLRRALTVYPKVRVNSPAGAIPHILNLSVQEVKGSEFQQALDRHGVCVSVKSACSVEGTPSRAVFAVSRDRKNALCSWRISLSHRTTRAELEDFLGIFDQCYHELTER